MTHGYNNDDELNAVVGAYSYVQSTAYSAYNQVAQVQLGSSTSYSTVTDSYDAHTGDLADQLVTRSTTTPASVDETAYKYDLSGNITRQTETRSGSSATSETQCFGYDALDRLTTAWTATDNCSATPTSSDHSTVGDGITGGTYWTSWTYDAIGNRDTQTQHTVSGTGSDTITHNAYSSSQPNTLTGTTDTGGSTGTTSYGYDSAGNTTTRDTSTGDQSLIWNNAGQLTNVSNSTTGTATSYIYDADGNLLLQIDPSTTTLYLGSEQITLNDSAGTATGVRYYTAPGGATAVRTGTGTNYGFELASDQHGTNTLYLDYTAQTPTWRQSDPYGNSRGTTATWVDNRTFLDKTTDTTTGLTDVGAREYDPTLGRFISLDPLFENTSPQELGGYTYAGDNPVTFSDPTGQEIGSKPNSCQYDLANCPKKVQKEVGYDPKTGRADYRRGTVVHHTNTKKTLSTAIVCGRVCVVTKENAEKKKADDAARKAERKRLANAADRTVAYLGDHLAAGVTGCMVICVGAQVAQGGLWPSVGGLGFGGFGKVVGWTSATPEEQGSTSYSLCIALGEGGCISFGEKGHSGSGKWWLGVSYAPGVGAFAGINYDHEVLPYNKSWGY